MVALYGTHGHVPEAKFIQHDGVAKEIKHAVVSHSTSGDNTLVAAVAGKSIMVLSAVLVAAGSVSARFESGAGGTALTGQMPLAANTVVELSFNHGGWFKTASGALLNLELSGAVLVAGCISYVEL